MHTINRLSKKIDRIVLNFRNSRKERYIDFSISYQRQPVCIKNTRPKRSMKPIPLICGLKLEPYLGGDQHCLETTALAQHVGHRMMSFTRCIEILNLR